MGTCYLKLYADINRGGTEITWRGTTGSENVQNVSGIDYRFGYNKASSYEVGADKHCMIVGYNWHGGGIHHNNGVPKGDIKMFKHGVNNDLRNVEGRETRHFNDDLDGIRLQFVPGAGSGQMQHPINVPAQKPHNYFSPRTVTGEVLDSNGVRFTPCPGGTAYFNSQSGITCIYDKSASALQTLHDAVGGGAKSNQAAMLTYFRSEFCKDSENAFKSVGGGETCMEYGAGQEIAMEYCGEGSRITPENRGGDANCTSTTLDIDNYNQLAEQYCDANPGDSWCACYNVYKHANDGSFCDSNPTAAGCSKKVQSFDAMVNKVPSDQRAQFAGQDHCFGGVCGLNTYKPDKYRDPCSSQINVCIQDFTIESLVDTNFQAACVIDTGSGDGPSVDDQGQTGQSAGDIITKDNLKNAEQELVDAEAAVAAGEPGAEERLAAAKKALREAKADVLEPPSLTDLQNNPQAYFPQSIDGLKTDQRQQIGAGVIGAVALAFMMMMLLLVAGGGGAPVRKRRYR